MFKWEQVERLKDVEVMHRLTAYIMAYAAAAQNCFSAFAIKKYCIILNVFVSDGLYWFNNSISLSTISDYIQILNI